MSSRLQEEKKIPDGQAEEVDHKGHEEQKDGIRKGALDEAIGEAKEKQARTPWHREGSDQPPVKRDRRASAMTKGESRFLEIGPLHVHLRVMGLIF